MEIFIINQSHASDPFLRPLKTSENQILLLKIDIFLDSQSFQCF